MANTSYAHYISGLTDLKVTKLDGSVQEDLDAAQEMSVTITQAEAVLEGDDEEKATKSQVKGIEGTVGAGSVSSGALAIMMGITPTTSGTTPNRVTTISINSGQKMPYFKLSGMSHDDQTGAMQVILPKVKLSGDIEFSLEQGTDNWFMPSFDFRGVKDGSGKLIDIILQETATALPTS